MVAGSITQRVERRQPAVTDSGSESTAIASDFDVTTDVLTAAERLSRTLQHPPGCGALRVKIVALLKIGNFGWLHFILYMTHNTI
jgi:hypothetical protein